MTQINTVYLLLTIAGSLVAILLSIAAAFFAIGYYKQGKTQQSLDAGNDKLNTNSLLKEQIDALEGKVDRQSAEIQDLTLKVKTLTTALEEERKKFAETILTLQTQNPTMIDFINAQNEFMTYTKLILVRVDKYLNHVSF